MCLFNWILGVILFMQPKSCSSVVNIIIVKQASTFIVFFVDEVVVIIKEVLDLTKISTSDFLSEVVRDPRHGSLEMIASSQPKESNERIRGSQRSIQGKF